MHIAWLSPYSQRSAIGAYTAAIIEELSKTADVSLFASDLKDQQGAWTSFDRIYPMLAMDEVDIIERVQRHDIAVYNLGDYLPFHRLILTVARQVPGIVVLHDLVMHHLFFELYLQELHDPPGYLNELEYAHGNSGRNFGTRVLSGLDQNLLQDRQVLNFHMAKSAVGQSYGVVVHSEFAERHLRNEVGALIRKIDFPLYGVSKRISNAATLSQGTSEGPVRLLTYGMLNPNKMVGEVLEVIGGNDFLKENVTFVILGQVSSSERSRYERLIRKLTLDSNVELLLGWQPEDRLYDEIQRAEVVINLRNPHFGETSSVLQETMLMAKPTIVWKHGYYDEVPDDTVFKVADMESLETALERLVKDDNLRRQLGIRASEYARSTFNTERYCKDFREFVLRVQRSKPIFVLVDSLAQILAGMGVAPTEENLIDEFFPGLLDFEGPSPGDIP